MQSEQMANCLKCSIIIIVITIGSGKIAGTQYNKVIIVLYPGLVGLTLW